MKKYLVLLSLFISVQCCAQLNEESEKKTVREIVYRFFESLEKKDSVLYKSVVYTNGQIWVLRQQQDSLKHSMRYFSDDIKKVSVMTEVIQEKPLSFDIKIHNGIAVAWVPYELSLSGKFSHCGVDVFTLLKTNDGWKIVSTVYTVEPGGCTALKKN